MIAPPRPLPDPDAFPYGLLTITVWGPDEYGGRTGREYANGEGEWFWIRDHVVKLDLDQEYSWTFNGFRFNAFTRGYYKTPAVELPELVELALWSLERWAKDEGLIE